MLVDFFPCKIYFLRFSIFSSERILVSANEFQALVFTSGHTPRLQLFVSSVVSLLYTFIATLLQAIVLEKQPILNNNWWEVH